ncbi:GNAT family N-acetyltransferase [Streptomyces sp. NBC_01498]|uniref:GNAT family N-acetyltransferase n=1 Tax=Streptomyces sp. NBC_01498 TaxID=2975870 RepID=UPI002E7C4066|nr:GNAT family N-acetyltransferase [Streptomyces sp. NBC_01498]
MWPVSRTAPRLELREFTTEDADAVFAIYGSDEATEHLSFEPRSRDEVGQILERSVASAAAVPRVEFALAVVERDGGELIGFARLATDPHQQRAATIGFALRPDRSGIGYGVETVRLPLRLGFNELGPYRIRGARSALNSASARTMANRRNERGVHDPRTHPEERHMARLGRAGHPRPRMVHTLSL